MGDYTYYTPTSLLENDDDVEVCFRQNLLNETAYEVVRQAFYSCCTVGLSVKVKGRSSNSALPESTTVKSSNVGTIFYEYWRATHSFCKCNATYMHRTYFLRKEETNFYGWMWNCPIKMLYTVCSWSNLKDTLLSPLEQTGYYGVVERLKQYTHTLTGFLM